MLFNQLTFFKTHENIKFCPKLIRLYLFLEPWWKSMAQYGQEKLRQPTLHWECDSDRVNLHRTFSLPRIDEKNKNPRPYQGSCEKESKRDVCRIGKQLFFFPTDYGCPMKPFFSSKSQTFGLGQTIWADKFWGIFGRFISIHFGIVSPLSMFFINEPLFLQKN